MKTFKAYCDVPWYIKESAGLPDNYNNLTVDQQIFVDELCRRSLAESSVKEDLVCLKADLEDVIERL